MLNGLKVRVPDIQIEVGGRRGELEGDAARAVWDADAEVLPLSWGLIIANDLGADRRPEGYFDCRLFALPNAW